MALEAIYSQVPALQAGQKVEGLHNGRIRQGVVIEGATARHYTVRWEDGFKTTQQQGFDYGDDLRPVDGGAE